jgi:hypothetical protein
MVYQLHCGRRGQTIRLKAWKPSGKWHKNSSTLVRLFPAIPKESLTEIRCSRASHQAREGTEREVHSRWFPGVESKGLPTIHPCFGDARLVSRDVIFAHQFLQTDLSQGREYGYFCLRDSRHVGCGSKGVLCRVQKEMETVGWCVECMPGTQTQTDKTNLEEFLRIAALIAEGEAKHNKCDNLEYLLTKKIASVRYPMQELELNYPTMKGKVYNEEEDRYLLCRLNYYGMHADDVYE